MSAVVLDFRPRPKPEPRLTAEDIRESAERIAMFAAAEAQRLAHKLDPSACARVEPELAARKLASAGAMLLSLATRQLESAREAVAEKANG